MYNPVWFVNRQNESVLAEVVAVTRVCKAQQSLLIVISKVLTILAVAECSTRKPARSVGVRQPERRIRLSGSPASLTLT